ncbi:uncharacterized protein LOC110735996 [Chenopodium quinoa]|uniref:uncharacterized protein LOC110735996 n=1 Tax=Chenopodium quinoa TaxID=63459 RepID=UPI000B78A64A|nr:uncharacterized protein LOC110735996 [Chenopodium quinoa]
MMYKMQLKCQKLILHNHSTVTEGGEPERPPQGLIPDLNLPPACNQQLNISEDSVDVLKKLNSHELTVNASNSKVSSYSEKLLPFNKRKSQYYVYQEERGSVVPTIQKNGCPGGVMKRQKYRSLQSIYRRTRPISSV